jgi:hypothetical protein
MYCKIVNYKKLYACGPKCFKLVAVTEPRAEYCVSVPSEKIIGPFRSGYILEDFGARKILERFMKF